MKTIHQARRTAERTFELNHFVKCYRADIARLMQTKHDRKYLNDEIRTFIRDVFTPLLQNSRTYAQSTAWQTLTTRFTNLYPETKLKDHAGNGNVC